jgi:hypothetical protein
MPGTIKPESLAQIEPRYPHDKKFLKQIPKYDGFTNKPSHTNYQQVVNGFYNSYHEIEGDIEEGTYVYTELFLKQIFKEQYDLILDYLSLLWCYPTQILPILCLVSTSRSTSKTTFLNWMMEVFERNMKIIKTEDMRNNFNSDWADRLMIAIDEAKFSKPSDSEKIKNLSTAKYNNIEPKGKDRFQIPFFGKFIITSNHENDFILVDQEEIRFWVVELEKPTKRFEDLDKKLKAELPAFKYFIQNREIKTPKKSRMWFSKEEIHTAALDRVVKGSNFSIEKEMQTILLEKLEDIEKTEVKFTISDIQNLLKENNLRAKLSEINQVIELKWKLRKSDNATSYKSYTKYYNEYYKEYRVDAEPRKGRVFTFQKEFLERF